MKIATKPADIKRRSTTLVGLIGEHGLIKVAHAAMASVEGLRQCASPNAPRFVSEESLLLAQYRLADTAVWAAKDWVKIEKAEAAKVKAAEKKQVASEKAKAARIKDKLAAVNKRKAPKVIPLKERKKTTVAKKPAAIAVSRVKTKKRASVVK